MKQSFVAGLFAIVLVCVGAAHAGQPKTVRVLFIGNSYTYYHDLPALIDQIAESKGHKLLWKMQTPGGRTFEKHWTEGKAVKKLHAEKWDVVVMQNQSFQGVIDPANMIEFGLKLTGEINKAKAKPLLFMTWAYKTKPKRIDPAKHPHIEAPAATYPQFMQKKLADAYYELAKQSNSQVAPVGYAWEIARQRFPDWPLHGKDGAHPGPVGSYLAAMVFYAKLFDDAPTGMPLKLENRWKRKKKKQPLPLIELPEAQVRAMEKITAEAIERGKQRMKQGRSAEVQAKE